MLENLHAVSTILKLTMTLVLVEKRRFHLLGKRTVLNLYHSSSVFQASFKQVSIVLAIRMPRFRDFRAFLWKNAES